MFTVIWTKSAENQLAELWLELSPTDRSAVTQAANRLDQELTRSPNSLGESRSYENERVCFDFPLGIRFRIEQSDALVRVLHVWCWRRKNS